MLKLNIDPVAVPMARDNYGLLQVPARYGHALRRMHRQIGLAATVGCAPCILHLLYRVAALRCTNRATLIRRACHMQTCVDTTKPLSHKSNLD